MRLIAAIFFILLVTPLSAFTFADDSLSTQYRLASGDTIKVLVYDESDLTVEAQIDDSGTLNYPFLGKLKVKGLTVGELQTLIHKGLLGDYLINPKVLVSIVEYRQFFISGEVERPGGFPFLPGLTVGKAVSLAEGLTERANKKAIYIVSDDDEATAKPRRVRLSSPVKPGDIITIEQSFF